MNKQQVEDLKILDLNFKIARETTHYNETYRHIHIVDVPIKEKSKCCMKLHVGKSDIFTKDSLKIFQDNTLCRRI